MARRKKTLFCSRRERRPQRGRCRSVARAAPQPRGPGPPFQRAVSFPQQSKNAPRMCRPCIWCSALYLNSGRTGFALLQTRKDTGAGVPEVQRPEICLPKHSFRTRICGGLQKWDSLKNSQACMSQLAVGSPCSIACEAGRQTRQRRDQTLHRVLGQGDWGADHSSTDTKIGPIKNWIAE
jgi:hypothetical protein